MINPVQNFHIVTLPPNQEKPFKIVKHAIDNSTGDVLGTVEASVTQKAIYPKGKIHLSYLIQSDNPIKIAKPHIHIDDLYVYENARKKGVGKALVANIAKESKQRGLKGRIILLAGSNEASPLPFYKKLGFITNSKYLNNTIDYAIKYKSQLSNKIQAFMTLSEKAANALIKSIR